VLEGKRAVITGGTAGIGRAVARSFVAAGACVIVVGRDEERGRAAVAELGETGRFVPGDVAHPATSLRAVDAACAAWGGLDVLVNNAALDHTDALLEVTAHEARRVLEVNLLGALFMLQAAARQMTREGGGSIVNVTSRLASIGVPTMGLYAASKGGLLALTRTAAVELAPQRIRVNAVAPGLTETPLLTAWLEQQDDPTGVRAAAEAQIPQHRFAKPEEVARAVAFLASDQASHVTGTSLAVDGGYTAQ
jgi:NAD(P)-dependent dehydrogenase (short-subunit alcohol dehydrogenase family)